MRTRVAGEWLLALSVCLLCSNVLQAQPLYSKNLAPLSGLFGFPALREAATLPVGQFDGALFASVTNIYSVADNARESVNFDGETQRITVRLRYGLAAEWELEGELPWLQHHGGQLDHPIEQWHDLWGLPNGGREKVPRGLIDFSYQSPVASFAMAESGDGWGDLNLALVRQVWRDESAWLSARAGVKLATGNERQLCGSGSEDYYLSVNYSGAAPGARPLNWHAQLGYLRAGVSDWLGAIQERDLWFAGAGLEWQAWTSVQLKIQLNSHAAVADSQLDQLGSSAVQLSAGIGWRFAPQWEAEFSFSEDIAVDTAPDFGVQIGLRYRSSAR